jgi:hypothetical protein
MKGELDEKVVISKMEITTPHKAIKGKTHSSETNFYKACKNAAKDCPSQRFFISY